MLVELNDIDSESSLTTAVKASKKDAEAIIEYLNEQAKSKFKATVANMKYVRARLEEGYTVDEIKMVVRKKAIDWLNDPRMRMYLRPETLFNATKFPSYLNEAQMTNIVAVQQPSKKAKADIR